MEERKKAIVTYGDKIWGHKTLLICLFLLSAALITSCLWTAKNHMEEVLRSYSDWWGKLEDIPGYHHVVDFGQLKVHLCGDDQVMADGYFDAHGVPPCSTAGFCWAGGLVSHEQTRYEIWIKARGTESGKRIPDIFALGHEMSHVLDIALGLMGFDDALDNPDLTLDEGFYR